MVTLRRGWMIESEKKLVKTERTISWTLYGAAFVAALVIFGIGIWIGLQIESSVTNQLTNTATTINQDWVSLETLMMMENSPMFCGYIKDQMQSFDSETVDLGNKIGVMEESRGVDPNLKFEYMSLETRDYLTAQMINERCGTNTSLILYFISSSNCPICSQQGAELTTARENRNIRVYTFDMDVNNSMASALADAYNIFSYPSIVVNGKTYTGLVSSASILLATNSSG